MVWCYDMVTLMFMQACTFAAQCAVLCERHCTKLQDISGEFGETTALDLACSTGGTSFELASRCVAFLLIVMLLESVAVRQHSTELLGHCEDGNGGGGGGDEVS